MLDLHRSRLDKARVNCSGHARVGQFVHVYAVLISFQLLWFAYACLYVT